MYRWRGGVAARRLSSSANRLRPTSHGTHSFVPTTTGCFYSYGKGRMAGWLYAEGFSEGTEALGESVLSTVTSTACSSTRSSD